MLRWRSRARRVTTMALGSLLLRRRCWRARVLLLRVLLGLLRRRLVSSLRAGPGIVQGRQIKIIYTDLTAILYGSILRLPFAL